MVEADGPEKPEIDAEENACTDEDEKGDEDELSHGLKVRNSVSKVGGRCRCRWQVQVQMQVAGCRWQGAGVLSWVLFGGNDIQSMLRGSFDGQELLSAKWRRLYLQQKKF